jgi:hypothetical protein
MTVCSKTSREDATFLVSLVAVRLHTWPNPNHRHFERCTLFAEEEQHSFREYLGSPFSVSCLDTADSRNNRPLFTANRIGVRLLSTACPRQWPAATRVVHDSGTRSRRYSNTCKGRMFRSSLNKKGKRK